MTEIRPARAADALRLARQVTQLGYPSELDAVTNGLHTMVVRSNVVRPESHLFYEGIEYQRMATSHVYHKQV
jgi:hypothetical protein